MIDKPKRNFWRFHLSTAVVMMLIAGTLLAGNLGGSLAGASEYGFPFPMYYRQAPPYPFGRPIEQFHFGPFYWSYNDNGWCSRLVVANVLFDLLSLAGVAVTAEWLIRRREGLKP